MGGRLEGPPTRKCPSGIFISSINDLVTYQTHKDWYPWFKMVKILFNYKRDSRITSKLSSQIVGYRKIQFLKFTLWKNSAFVMKVLKWF